MATEAIKHFRRVTPTEPLPEAVTDSYRQKDELAYLLSQLPLGTRRPMKVVVVGAGLSGLAFAREVQVGNLAAVDLVIYEKNSSVGGTWFENRYPGCACDIPSHNYQYSWAPNPYFKSYYAGSADIQQYIERVADQHNLRHYVKTCHKVVGAKWIDEHQKWEVSVRRTDGREIVVSNRVETAGEVGDTLVEECDVFINATGFVNDWRWPSIPGRQLFQGKILHSAAWDRKTSLSGKTVALIGNGSSGVQILPAIIDEVEKVYVFMRSPTWVTAPFAQKYAGKDGANFNFSAEQQKQWADNPEEYLAYRKEVEAELSHRFRLYLKDSKEQKMAKDFSLEQMSAKLAKKPEILKLLLPTFAVGCRRPTPGNGYLEALCSDKCEVIWGSVEAFTPTGLRSASNFEATVDTIICATGFNIAFSPRFPIVGKDGVNLQTVWDSNPQCYLSLTAANMPNYFTFLGPHSPIGQGSITSSVEIISAYIVDMIQKLQTENYASFCPKPHVPSAWQKQALAWLDKTAWNSHCVSTFKNGTRGGPLISLHPGSRLHYFRLLQTRRYEDFDWVSLSPDPDMTFAWLGNGFTTEETEQDTDVNLTWFLKAAPKEAHIKPVVEDRHTNGYSTYHGGSH